MATNANEILDRLAALLDAANPCFHSDCEARTYSALLNAAPALIRLARAAIAMRKWTKDTGPTSVITVDALAREMDCAEMDLGEVRL